MGCAMYVIGTASKRQQWNEYPESPVLSSEYPYQVIYHFPNDSQPYFLFVFPSPLFMATEIVGQSFSVHIYETNTGTLGESYQLIDGAWVYNSETYQALSLVGSSSDQEGAVALALSMIPQSNQDIYYGDSLEIPHTTETKVGESTRKRVRRVWHKSSCFEQSNAVRWKGTNAWGRVNT